MDLDGVIVVDLDEVGGVDLDELGGVDLDGVGGVDLDEVGGVDLDGVIGVDLDGVSGVVSDGVCLFSIVIDCPIVELYCEVGVVLKIFTLSFWYKKSVLERIRPMRVLELFLNPTNYSTGSLSELNPTNGSTGTFTEYNQ